MRPVRRAIVRAVIDTTTRLQVALVQTYRPASPSTVPLWLIEEKWYGELGRVLHHATIYPRGEP